MQKLKSLVLPAAGILLIIASLATCGRSGPDAPPDLTPPAVASVDPPDQSADVPLNKTLTITFTEPVDQKTISFTLADAANMVDPAAITMSYSGDSAVFTLPLLDANTLYTASLNPGVKDLAGNAMLTQFAWRFKTGTTIATGPTHTITATAGPNGSMAPQGAVGVADAASQQFTITPSQGYQIADVQVDGASVGLVTTYTFTNVKADHTIAASFTASTVPTHTITASAGTGGSISPSGTVIVNDGAVQKFTIAAVSGYHLTNVQGCGGSLSGNIYTTAPVTADCSVTAAFAADAPTTHTISAGASGGGSISPSGSITVNNGASQKFTMTPNSGYHISDVTVDGGSVGAVSTYTISNVTTDHTIYASFAATVYTITATAGTGGSISPSGPVTVNQGAAKSFTLTANTGYQVANVSGTCGGKLSGTTYTTAPINGNCTVTASFKKSSHTIKSSAGANGSISPVGNVIVADGASETFAIAPATGYVIQAVQVDTDPAVVVSSYQFSNVTQDHTIAASFAAPLPVTHTISTTTGTGGTIAPTGPVVVNDGGSVQFIMAASAGYHLIDVAVDGTSLGVLPTYTFSNVTVDHTIAATFAADVQVTHTITASAATGGQITPVGAVSVPDGGMQQFAITPDPGYSILQVLVDTAVLGPVTTYEFINVTADHTITAQFSLIPMTQ